MQNSDDGLLFVFDFFVFISFTRNVTKTACHKPIKSRGQTNTKSRKGVAAI